MIHFVFAYVRTNMLQVTAYLFTANGRIKNALTGIKLLAEHKKENTGYLKIYLL